MDEAGVEVEVEVDSVVAEEEVASVVDPEEVADMEVWHFELKTCCFFQGCQRFSVEVEFMTSDSSGALILLIFSFIFSSLLGNNYCCEAI